MEVCIIKGHDKHEGFEILHVASNSLKATLWEQQHSAKIAEYDWISYEIFTVDEK